MVNPPCLRVFTYELINFVLLTHLHDFVALLLWIVVPQNFVDVLKNTVFKLAQHPFMLLLLCWFWLIVFTCFGLILIDCFKCGFRPYLFPFIFIQGCISLSHFWFFPPPGIIFFLHRVASRFYIYDFLPHIAIKQWS